MRINLSVRFEEKDAAKALGARLDPKQRTWYLVDPVDLVQFIRWMPGVRLNGSAKKKCKPRRAHANGSAKPATTERTDDSLIDCGCTHVAPWMDCGCGHVLDQDQSDHIRSILAS